MSLCLTPGEEIRPIPGLEGRYSVTSTGRVFSHVYRHRNYTVELARSTHPEGYIRVKVAPISNTNWTPIHRLVALAFHPNPHGLPQVNHINGNKGDNRAENLEWVSNAENQRHSCRIGLHVALVGEKHPMAVINEETAISIKKALRGASYKGQLTDIAAAHGATKYIVFDIKRGKTWRHINVV